MGISKLGASIKGIKIISKTPLPTKSWEQGTLVPQGVREQEGREPCPWLLVLPWSRAQESHSSSGQSSSSDVSVSVRVLPCFQVWLSWGPWTLHLAAQESPRDHSSALSHRFLASVSPTPHHGACLRLPPRDCGGAGSRPGPWRVALHPSAHLSATPAEVPLLPSCPP